MTDDERAGEEPNWLVRNWIVIAAIAATLVWAMVLYLMLQTSEPCPAVDGKFNGLLSCRTSNEIGDLLSGAFSPLAFVWLVAAVLMQSTELRAQRLELRFTRKEFELTRSEVEAQRMAMEAQVLETRKNVDFIGEQTALLRQERERSEFREVEQDIDELIEIAVQLGHEYADRFKVNPDFDTKGIFGSKVEFEKSAFLTNKEILKDYLLSTDREWSALDMFMTEGEDLIYEGLRYLEAFEDQITEIAKLADKASAVKKSQLEFMGLTRGHTALAQLRDKITREGKPRDEFDF